MSPRSTPAVARSSAYRVSEARAATSDTTAPNAAGGGGSASVAWLTERGYRFCWYEGRPETSKLAKGLYDLREAFLGVEDRIVYGDEVPVRFHNMLIAVPPRYQQVLGLDRKAAPAG